MNIECVKQEAELLQTNRATRYVRRQYGGCQVAKYRSPGVRTYLKTGPNMETPNAYRG